MLSIVRGAGIRAGAGLRNQAIRLKKLKPFKLRAV
jgi:hypothetical protein